MRTKKLSNYKKLILSVSNLYSVKTITDEFDNKYVILKENALEEIENVTDKTQFEALENHVHLIDNIKPSDFEDLSEFCLFLGDSVLNSLENTFPDKKFVVYVVLSDSLTVRFHQQWLGESEYFDDDEYPNERVYKFRSV